MEQCIICFDKQHLIPTKCEECKAHIILCVECMIKTKGFCVVCQREPMNALLACDWCRYPVSTICAHLCAHCLHWSCERCIKGRHGSDFMFCSRWCEYTRYDMDQPRPSHWKCQFIEHRKGCWL